MHCWTKERQALPSSERISGSLFDVHLEHPAFILNCFSGLRIDPHPIDFTHSCRPAAEGRLKSILERFPAEGWMELTVSGDRIFAYRNEKPDDDSVHQRAPRTTYLPDKYRRIISLCQERRPLPSSGFSVS